MTTIVTLDIYQIYIFHLVFPVAIVVALSGTIGLPLPLWPSQKVNNNLERINVTNGENRDAGKKENNIQSSQFSSVRCPSGMLSQIAK